MKRGYETTVHKRKIIYEWNIKKFSSYVTSSKNKETLRSTQFSSGANINDLWCLMLKFNNETPPESKDWISLSIQSLSDQDNISADYVSYVVQNDNSKRKTETMHGIWKKKQNFHRIDEFLRKDNVQDILAADVLTLGVELTVYDHDVDAAHISEKKVKILKPNPKIQILKDLKELYNSKIGADVVINVQGKEFDAHKSILLARSPVFSAMFLNNPAEDNKNEISDIEPEVFEKLLEYCYTDEVTDLDDDSKKLLEAAVKYQLNSLKRMCENSLLTTMKIDNAVKRLILAKNYDFTELFNCAIDFIIIHAAEVIETPDYKKIIENANPSLSSALFARVINIYQQNPPKIIHHS